MHPNGPAVTCDATLTDQDKADILEAYGVAVTDIQENIAVANDAITGTSKYVATATGFDMSKGHNFIALHFTSPTATKIEVSMDPTQGSGLVELDESGVIVLQMKADKSQTVKVVATDANGVTTKNLTISGMTFNEE